MSMSPRTKVLKSITNNTDGISHRDLLAIVSKDMNSIKLAEAIDDLVADGEILVLKKEGEKGRMYCPVVISDSDVKTHSAISKVEISEIAEDEEDVKINMLGFLEGYKNVSRKNGVLTIKELYDRHTGNTLHYEPDFQREPGVWTGKDCQDLIDTILKNLAMPPLYFHVKGDKWDIMDGLQRITVILRFMGITFKIKDQECKSFSYNGTSYTDLPDEIKEQFNKYELSCVWFGEKTTEEIVREQFRKLQQGSRLNPQEKRDAMAGRLVQPASWLAMHPILKMSAISAKRKGYKKAATVLLLAAYNNYKPCGTSENDINKFGEDSDEDAKAKLDKAQSEVDKILTCIHTLISPRAKNGKLIGLGKVDLTTLFFWVGDKIINSGKSNKELKEPMIKLAEFAKLARMSPKDLEEDGIQIKPEIQVLISTHRQHKRATTGARELVGRLKVLDKVVALDLPFTEALKNEAA